MKKVLVFLLVCFAGITLRAQELHWTMDQGHGAAGGNTSMTGVLYIDHVEYDDPSQLEIGVFDQDGRCRGAKLPKWNNSKQKWIYQLIIKGNEGFEYTFKIYDHATEAELDYVDDFGEIITWGSGKKYGSISNLYEINFTSSTSAQTFTKDIIGYGANEGGYYLIASPIMEVVNPSTNNGFITSAYDLYYFGQDQELEWINFKDDEVGGFSIANGDGYLYASQEDTQLTFTGTPYIGNGEVTLYMFGGAEFEGWNLIGNPFAADATLNKAYYRLNTDGTAVNAETESSVVAAMEGIFVKADTDGEIVTFTENSSSKSSQLNIHLSEGNRQADNAIVRFDNGSILEKFSFRQGSSKVYMPIEDKDYAIVSAENNVGEMPVCFKAEKNGTYTLSFSNENVEFGYLHLIDNLTGNDVDLIANPSYTFEANTTDYASRFRLVFSTGSCDDTFAFYSNGNIIVTNAEAGATMQIVDMMGRVISSESINGSTSISLNAAKGVYVLRLINGENVKTQKIVVE